MPNKLPPPPFSKEKNSISLLFLGDVVGKSALRKLEKYLPQIQETWAIDFTIVNGENSDGMGMGPESAKKLLKAGADVITGGNHTLKQFSIHKLLESEKRILRPANIGSKKTPGEGVVTLETDFGSVCVINLLGQVYLGSANSPFHLATKLIKANPAKFTFVDFHAEATGEKISLAHFLDGKVSLVAGTHTHVPTADARILPGGTGAITDLGICGSTSGILGMKTKGILHYNLHLLPSKFVPSGKDIQLQGILASFDKNQGNCLKISRINIDV